VTLRQNGDKKPRVCSQGTEKNGYFMDYDLITIGAGSGGVRASRMAAQLGASVMVIEASDLGGTCVNLGCIPKKLFSYASHFPHDFKVAADFGWTLGPVKFDWSVLIAQKNNEIKRLNGIYASLLEKSGAKVVHGRARVTSATSVQVNGQSYQTKKILIATGSRPKTLALSGWEWTESSDQAFHWQDLPKKMAILGGGYIACEFAGIFAGLGVKVDLIYRGATLLRGFDHEVCEHVTNEMRERGVTLHLKQDIDKIEKTDKGLEIFCAGGLHLSTDRILQALGRRPQSDNIGLEALGLAINPAGAIQVDENFQSSVPGVYALGDVIDQVNLTPVALGQAMAFVKTQFENQPTLFNPRAIPTAVFSDPPLACIGLSEEEARKKCAKVKVYRSHFRPLRNTLGSHTQRTFMKLVVDAATDRVLGCHMAGDDAPEIIQGFAVAVNMGASKHHFDQTLGIHPTSAEEFVTMRD
jgi:glutathione reductase (NADPH)